MNARDVSHSEHGKSFQFRPVAVALLIIWGVMFGRVWPAEAQAQPTAITLAIVQPKNIAAYQTAVQGFLETIKEQRFPQPVQSVVYDTPEALYQALAEQRQHGQTSPITLILTVGTAASQDVAARIHDIPLVFAMVLSPETTLPQNAPMVGAALDIPLALQFELIREVLPMAQTIGVLYDPQRNLALIDEYRASAARFQFELRAVPVASQKDLPAALDQVTQTADVLLGIVDNTVYTSQTSKFIIRATVKNRIPFIAISPSYVKAGALCALMLDSRDIGRQAAELAIQRLNGESAAALQNTAPVKLDLAINLRTAKIIDVTIPEKLLQRAALVYE